MSYVIYNIHTTQQFRVRTSSGGNGCYRDSWKTESAAKSVLTRNVKKGKIVREEYAIAEINFFRTTVEKTETVTNLMSGKEVKQSVNTPLCCDPSSETYWSM